MRTYLFSDEDIRRYVYDFAQRLESLGSQFPVVWLSMGESGDKIVEVLQPLLSKKFQDLILVEPIYYNRTSQKVLARDGKNLPSYKEHGPILLVDGAVHSGGSMLAAARAALNSDATDIITYSFVVKRTSIFIPNYFAILIDEHDRPYFQLTVVPNNELVQKAPFGILRRICAEDAKKTKQFLSTGVPSIDRTSLGDLWYSDRTEGSQVFVYEMGNSVVGYISFNVSDGELYIEQLANDQAVRNTGVGGMLMRWAGTFARSCCCNAVSLRSHNDRIGFYEKYGFRAVGVPIEIGGGETYTLMRKPVVYTGNPTHHVDS